MSDQQRKSAYADSWRRALCEIAAAIGWKDVLLESDFPDGPSVAKDVREVIGRHDEEIAAWKARVEQLEAELDDAHKAALDFEARLAFEVGAAGPDPRELIIAAVRLAVSGGGR